MKQEKENKERPGDGCPVEGREDPGKIHRSVGVRCSGVSDDEGKWEEDEDRGNEVVGQRARLKR